MVKLYIYFFLFVFCISAIADDNYYKILGVDPTASADEIKQAYRKQAQKWHPDRNRDPKAGEYMAKINEAYQVLGDLRQRGIYDASFARYTHSGTNTTSGSSQATGRAKSRADQQAQDLRDAINENQPLSAVKKLLDEGADPNARDIFRRTPLFYSLLNGDLEIARLLMENGADINFQNSNKETVLLQLFEQLNISNLELSQRNNILQGIQFALENGADPNIVHTSGRTSLYYSLLNGDLEIARLLMENGVDINLRHSIYRETVLLTLVKSFYVSESADRKNILKGIQFVLENGADPYIVDRNGLTPLFYSLYLSSGDFEVADLLLKNKTNINFQDKLGFTVLGELLLQVQGKEDQDKYLKAFEFALARGADPLIPDSFGAFDNVFDHVKSMRRYSKIRELMKPYVEKDNSVQCRTVISRLKVTP